MEEEDLLGLPEDLREDEPFVEGTDRPSGPDVAQPVRALVGDEGERRVEPFERPATGMELRAVASERSESFQVRDERLPVRVGELPRRLGGP